MKIRFEKARFKTYLPDKEIETEFLDWITCKAKLANGDGMFEPSVEINLIQILGVPFKIALVLIGHLLWLLILVGLLLKCVSIGPRSKGWLSIMEERLMPEKPKKKAVYTASCLFPNEEIRDTVMNAIKAGEEEARMKKHKMIKVRNYLERRGHKVEWVSGQDLGYSRYSTGGEIRVDGVQISRRNFELRNDGRHWAYEHQIIDACMRVGIKIGEPKPTGYLVPVILAFSIVMMILVGILKYLMGR